MKGDCDICDRVQITLRHIEVEALDQLILDEQEGTVAVCGRCIKKQADREHAEHMEEKRRRDIRTENWW